MPQCPKCQKKLKVQGREHKLRCTNPKCPVIFPKDREGRTLRLATYILGGKTYTIGVGKIE